MSTPQRSTQQGSRSSPGAARVAASQHFTASSVSRYSNDNVWRGLAVSWALLSEEGGHRVILQLFSHADRLEAGLAQQPKAVIFACSLLIT